MLTLRLTGWAIATASSVLVFTSFPFACFGLSAAEVSQIAKKITVRIESQSYGSGVLINQQGKTYTVLTSAHVVNSDDTYEILTPDRQRYIANKAKIQRLKGIDLALLEFTSDQSYSVASFGNASTLREGIPCYVAGFPIKTLAITDVIYTFSSGLITAQAARPLQDGYSLVYSNNTLPGMSGGAILNEQGELVGIHGRADTTESAQDPELNPNVYVKTGFNLGIPINTFFQNLPPLPELKHLVNLPGSTIATGSNSEDVFVQGAQQLSQGQSKDAIASFSQALSTRDRNAQAYHGRGIARTKRGDYDGAIADLNAALSIDPYQATFYNSRGIAYLEVAFQGDRSALDRAEADFSEAIRIDPNFGEAYNNRGLARMNMGARELAIEDYTQALRLDSAFAKAYRNRGHARSAIQDKRGAIDDFTRALQIVSNDPESYRARGFTWFELQESATALQDLTQGLAIAPKDIDLLTTRGIVLYEQNPQAAIADWRSAVNAPVRASAEAAFAQLLLAAALSAQGQSSEAASLVRASIASDRSWTNEGTLSGVLGDRLLQDTLTLINTPEVQQQLRD
jgi:tetratricopeptide (TPR) repeat protein